MKKTIFDLILSKEIDSWVIWEDKKFLAFLTPYPNTPGASVVIPKLNPGDYLFDLDDNLIADLMIAAKKVARISEKALRVKRVALVIEGTGVPYVHVKLYPLHGQLANQTNVWPSHQEFYQNYIGYLTTCEGPKMDDLQLSDIQKKFINLKNPK